MGSEGMRATINAFLQRTGTPSKKVMVVLASNQPEQLDWAISDRIDVPVKFPLPAFDERLRLVNMLYNNKILDGACKPQKSMNPFKPKARQLSVADEIPDNQDTIMNDIAEKTDGLSGRQLDKMVTGWEHTMYADAEGMLSKETVFKGIDQAVKDNQQRLDWLDSSEESGRQ